MQQLGPILVLLVHLHPLFAQGCLKTCRTHISRCRLGTLFAIHGRPFPWGPMICYSAYVTAIVCLIVLLLDDYSSSAKLKALLVSVQTIGTALSILHPCILIDLVAQIPERMISCGAAALTLNQLSNLPYAGLALFLLISFRTQTAYDR